MNSRTHTNMHHVPRDRQCSDYMASAVAMVRAREPARAARKRCTAPLPPLADRCVLLLHSFPFHGERAGV